MLNWECCLIPKIGAWNRPSLIHNPRHYDLMYPVAGHFEVAHKACRVHRALSVAATDILDSVLQKLTLSAALDVVKKADLLRCRKRNQINCSNRNGTDRRRPSIVP